MPVRSLVGMTMIMRVSRSTSCNPQTFIHGHERHEADHDRHAQQQVFVWLDEHGPDFALWDFSQEDLGQKMEECISKESSYCKRNHDVQATGIDVRRAESQEEIRWAGNVQGSHQGVQRGAREGEEDLEGLLEVGGGLWFGGGFVGDKGFDDGALL